MLEFLNIKLNIISESSPRTQVSTKHYYYKIEYYEVESNVFDKVQFWGHPNIYAGNKTSKKKFILFLCALCLLFVYPRLIKKLSIFFNPCFQFTIPILSFRFVFSLP